MSGLLGGLSGGVSAGIRLASGVGASVRNLSGLLSGAAFGGAQGVQLGPVTFLGFEVPDRINFGGEQSLEVHQFLGGGRQVDAMGPNDDGIRWSGTMLSADAADRARAADKVRISGLTVPLSWADFDFDVVVRKFRAEYRRSNWVEYEIECVVLADYGSTATPDASAGGILGSLGTALGDAAAQVGMVVSAVRSGVAAVASVVTPITSALGTSVPLLGQTQAALSQAAALSGSGPTTAAGVSCVGISLAGIGAQALTGVRSTGTALASAASVSASDLAGLASLAGLHAGFAYAGQAAGGAQATLTPLSAQPPAPVSLAA